MWTVSEKVFGLQEKSLQEGSQKGIPRIERNNLSKNVFVRKILFSRTTFGHCIKQFWTLWQRFSCKAVKTTLYNTLRENRLRERLQCWKFVRFWSNHKWSFGKKSSTNLIRTTFQLSRKTFLEIFFGGKLFFYPYFWT